MRFLHRWVQCDSESDLRARLEKARGTVLDVIVDDDPNRWGFVELDLDECTVIPVGFREVGMLPQAWILSDLILVGISGLLFGIARSSGQVSFRYQMPTIFHEFVRVDEVGILVQDEIGFVLLSYEGKVVWSVLKDIITDYSLDGKVLRFRTFDGENFCVEVGGQSQ